jgi:hypothetical protein
MNLQEIDAYSSDHFSKVFWADSIHDHCQADGPNDGGTGSLQDPSDNESCNVLAKRQHQSGPQKRSEATKERSATGVGSIGDDADRYGTDDTSASVGGEESGDIGLDLLLRKADSLSQQEG